MGLILGKEVEKKFPGLPYARSMYIDGLMDALSFGRTYGFPVVIKVISDKLIHKSDVKAVRIIKNEFELKKDFVSIAAIAKKYDGKIMIQEFVNGFELFVGVKKDETFGHVIGIGLGGVYVELLKKVSFRVCPVSKKDVLEMIEESGIEKIFEGFRGKQANLEKFVDVVIDISKIFSRSGIKEVDVNPLIVNEKDAKIVDIRVITE